MKRLSFGVLIALVAACAIGASPGAGKSQRGRLFLPAPAASPATAWTQFAFDAARDGDNPFEATLNGGTIGGLRLKWYAKLDSPILAQPLYLPSQSIDGSSHAVLYVTTFFGEYAIDPYASDGATSQSGLKIFWKRALPGPSTQCPGSGPNTFGIYDTPLLDIGTNKLYVVDGGRKIQALDLSNGLPASGFGYALDPQVDGGVDGAISENPSNGQLIVNEALRCGNEMTDVFAGHTFAIDRVTGAIRARFTSVTTAGYNGGDAWGMGGASIGGLQDAFIATGNSWPISKSFGEHVDYAEHVVALNTSLTPVAANFPNLTGTDVDFGSTPVLFQPPSCPKELAVTNKTGAFLFYDRGSIGSGPVANFAMGNPVMASTGTFIDEPVYDASTGFLYLTSALDSTTTPAFTHGLTAFAFTSCLPVVQWHVEQGMAAPTPAPGQPAHGAPDSSPTIAGKVIYFADGIGRRVYANSAISGHLLWKSPPLNGPAFTAPTVVDGRLYVVDENGFIYAFGL